MKAAPKTCAILCLHLLVLLIFSSFSCCCCCCCSCCGRCHFGRDRRGKTHLKHEHEKHLHKIVLTHLPPHRSRCRRPLFRPWPRTRQRCWKGKVGKGGKEGTRCAFGPNKLHEVSSSGPFCGPFHGKFNMPPKNRAKSKWAEFNGRGRAGAG